MPSPTPRLVRRAVPEHADRGFGRDLHPVLRRVYLARGVTGDQELDLSLRSLAQPSLGGLDAAAIRLADAVVGQQRILIVGDFDSDGATGTALALRVLRALGARHLDYCVPNRFDFGYGLSPALVEHLRPREPDLLVTVDNGISSIAGAARARELGMSVVVTDHHLPGAELPEVEAIVNPNLPGDPFPSKALAGVGVMFYLLGALRAELQRRDALLEPVRLADYLDLVAIGTVADMVPLDRNNRILVEQGLRRIRAGRACAGVAALLQVAGVNARRCSATDLAWRVAPRINAAGRLEDMGLGIDCLLSDRREQSDEAAAVLDRINSERRAIQSEMQEQAGTQARQVLSELTPDGTAGLCLFHDDWHEGVVGLIAGQIARTLHRPVVALAPAQAGEDALKGSVRSIAGIHARDVLAEIATRHPGVIEKFGGHAMAAGLSLGRDSLEAFRRHWQAVVGEHERSEAVIESDGALGPDELSLEVAAALELAGPWGQQFPEPLFDGHFRLFDKRPVGGGAHLKLELVEPGAGTRLPAIAFNCGAEAVPDRGDDLHIAYRLQVNRFRGREEPQLLVEHIWPRS